MRVTGGYGMNQSMDIPMTEEQKTTAEEILAKYDPENMTRDDMLAMRKEFHEAGIPRSRELQQMLQESGFKGPRKENENALQAQGNQFGTKRGALWQLYQQFQSGELNEEEFIEQIKNTPITGQLVNFLS
ncbi:hypothetical protein [Desulfovibrio ferrophilus]|uniref:Uncharacterized protein n=1 Tax=Desulfovibrio ferrophilus TaxID=241368 RepID=A0A2Z6AY15_9BACT|nr:hypothetical protein [Desulfovibrio ferrophilus]BBD08147.1 uncharacterized protein DFE_1421 [Desulfovibrio ferrophilus]